VESKLSPNVVIISNGRSQRFNGIWRHRSASV
jgi:hypothetical protein